MRGYLQLVATGPELSKSLDEHQARDGLAMILDGEIDPVRAGLFLIALRMKRETAAENIGAMQALNHVLCHGSANAPQVLAIADPFNGCLRGLPATPFLPAVLAACGLPSYIHGLEAVGPKYGITPHMIFAASGKRVDKTVDQAIAGIDQAGVGWSYLDQKIYLPELHRLVELRDTMVKRTCISTLEVVMKPIRGANRTHLMTGFVHKAYPPVYAMLAGKAGFDSAMIIRGVEGGCIPSLSQLSRYFAWYGPGSAASGEDVMRLHKLVPQEVGIVQDQRMVPIPGRFDELIAQTAYQQTAVLKPLVAHNLALGLDGLANKSGAMRDSLIYAASIALCHTGVCENRHQAADKVRKVLASGEALRRFESG